MHQTHHCTALAILHVIIHQNTDESIIIPVVVIEKLKVREVE